MIFEQIISDRGSVWGKIGGPSIYHTVIRYNHKYFILLGGGWYRAIDNSFMNHLTTLNGSQWVDVTPKEERALTRFVKKHKISSKSRANDG